MSIDLSLSEYEADIVKRLLDRAVIQCEIEQQTMRLAELDREDPTLKDAGFLDRVRRISMERRDEVQMKKRACQTLSTSLYLKIGDVKNAGIS